MRTAKLALAVTSLFVGIAADPALATVFPSGTIIVSNDFENQTNIGLGTDPTLFGTVTATNLPVNRPTAFTQANTAADAYVMTNNTGFASKHGEIYSGTASSGYQVDMGWGISALAISTGTYRVTWDASAGQVNKKGGHVMITAGNSFSWKNMFDLWFTSGGKFTVMGVTSNFSAYTANTPLAFALDLNLNTTNFNLAINGTKYVTNGVLQGFVATNLIGAITFQTYVLNNGPDYDGNKATFAIDNLKLSVAVPTPKGTMVCFR